MADLFQGSPLPSLTTTKQTQTTSPEFYTNYLQDIANLGQNAITQGGVAGFSPLQQQAFQMAPETAFAGAGSMGAASTLLGQAGATTVPDVIKNYMNPYTSGVVNEMARLQQQNIQRNIMPSLAAAGVGSGGYGSKRQLQATGQTLADMQANLTGQQLGALNTQYANAAQQAQNDLTRAMQAGEGLGQLGTAQQNLATTGLKTLSDYGAQQQALGQTMLNYPMVQAQNYAKLLQGYNIPTGTTEQTVGPGQAGAYSASPLSQIGGLGALLYSIYNQGGNAGTQAALSNIAGTGTTAAEGGSITSDNTTTPAQRLASKPIPANAIYHDGKGNYYDKNGNLVR